MMAAPLTAARTTLLRLATFAQARLTTTTGIWTLWGVTRALLLANLILGRHYCDPQFYQYAGDFATGKLPYRDISVEYPPLALLLMLLPALPLLPFASIAPRPDANPHPLHPDLLRYGAYGISFGLMMLALDALTLWLVMRFARRWTTGDARGGQASLLYVALVFASGALLQKFDLVVGTLCLVALAELLRHRDGRAWAWLVLATLAKGFPILLVPLFVLWRVRGTTVDWLAIRRGALGGGLAALAVLSPVLLAGGFAPLVQSVGYHTTRGTEIESVIASVALALAWLPGLQVYTTFNRADLSRDVHSALAGPLGTFGLAVLAFLAIWVYALLWRDERFAPRFGKGASQAQAMCLMSAATALLLFFTLCFRALPVHYLLAILPLVAVVRVPRGQRAWIAWLATCLILSQIVITFWHHVVALEPGFVLVLIIRNVALVAASVVLVRGSFFRNDEHRSERG